MSLFARAGFTLLPVLRLQTLRQTSVFVDIGKSILGKYLPLLFHGFGGKPE